MVYLCNEIDWKDHIRPDQKITNPTVTNIVLTHPIITNQVELQPENPIASVSTTAEITKKPIKVKFFDMFASIKPSTSKTKNRKVEPAPVTNDTSSSSDSEGCEVIDIIAPTDLDNEVMIKEEPKIANLEFCNRGCAVDVDIGGDFTPSSLTTPFKYILYNTRPNYRRADEILEVAERELRLISATYLDEITGELALLKFTDNIQIKGQEARTGSNNIDQL